MSPSLIHLSFLMISLKRSERRAGAMMQTTAIPTHAIGVSVPDFDIAEKHPIGPTIPHVPMPADTPVHSSLNTIVDIGPVIAAASVAGIQI